MNWKNVVIIVMSIACLLKIIRYIKNLNERCSEKFSIFKKKNTVKFNKDVTVFETYSADEYDRSTIL